MNYPNTRNSQAHKHHAWDPQSQVVTMRSFVGYSPERWLKGAGSPNPGAPLRRRRYVDVPAATGGRGSFGLRQDGGEPLLRGPFEGHEDHEAKYGQCAATEIQHERRAHRRTRGRKSSPKEIKDSVHGEGYSVYLSPSPSLCLRL